MGALETRVGRLERSGPTGGWRATAILLARRPRFLDEGTPEEHALVVQAATRLLHKRGLDLETVTADALARFMDSASADVRAVIVQTFRIIRRSRQDEGG